MAEKSLADRQEERSAKAADALRAALLGLATAGLAALYAIRDELSDGFYWRVAAFLFVTALACTLRSWFLVKDRAIKRRDAARNGSKPRKIEKWDLHASWLWDTAAAWLLIAGAASLAIGLA